MTKKQANTPMPSVFLAGPDAFLKDSEFRRDHLEALSYAGGLIPLPLQDEFLKKTLAQETTPEELAATAYFAKIEQIKGCDVFLANMEPFRGQIEPDSETAFQAGMAFALGKPVAFYMPQGVEPLADRVRRQCGEDFGEGRGRDVRFGTQIKDFGLPLGLMMAGSAPCFDNPKDALKHLLQEHNKKLDQNNIASGTMARKLTRRL
jgi:nucleoside 2-deoxyribosyltransferase